MYHASKGFCSRVWQVTWNSDFLQKWSRSLTMAMNVPEVSEAWLQQPGLEPPACRHTHTHTPTYAGGCSLESNSVPSLSAEL